MNVGAFISELAPFLSAIFVAVTAIFTVLLLMRAPARHLKFDDPIIEGRLPQEREAGKQETRGGRKSRLLRNFIEYVGNVSLTS
jgi:hypothetical protein